METASQDRRGATWAPCCWGASGREEHAHPLQMESWGTGFKDPPPRGEEASQDGSSGARGLLAKSWTGRPRLPPSSRMGGVHRLSCPTGLSLLLPGLLPACQLQAAAPCVPAGTPSNGGGGESWTHLRASSKPGSCLVAFSAPALIKNFGFGVRVKSFKRPSCTAPVSWKWGRGEGDWLVLKANPHLALPSVWNSWSWVPQAPSGFLGWGRGGCRVCSS